MRSQFWDVGGPKLGPPPFSAAHLDAPGRPYVKWEKTIKRVAKLHHHCNLRSVCEHIRDNGAAKHFLVRNGDFGSVSKANAGNVFGTRAIAPSFRLCPNPGPLDPILGIDYPASRGEMLWGLPPYEVLTPSLMYPSIEKFYPQPRQSSECSGYWSHTGT